jgi:hypothetical protein
MLAQSARENSTDLRKTSPKRASTARHQADWHRELASVLFHIIAPSRRNKFFKPAGFGGLFRARKMFSDSEGR